MTVFLGLFGPVSIVILLVIMGLLSQRLGAVTKRAPLFRLFYVSAGLVGLSAVLGVIQLIKPDANIETLYDVCFSVGLTLAVFIAWRYWGWLLKENGGNR